MAEMKLIVGGCDCGMKCNNHVKLTGRFETGEGRRSLFGSAQGPASEHVAGLFGSLLCMLQLLIA